MLFTYEATNEEGGTLKGEFEADSEAEVIEHLRRKGLVPVSLQRREGVFSGGGGTGLGHRLFETVSPLDRILMVRNLAASIRAGLGIIEALDILIADNSKPLVRRILVQAKMNLENGQPLSQSFASLKQYFPAVFVGMLKAGESAGKLDATLEQLSQTLTREYNLSKKVKSAMAYPALLLVASILVSLLLIVFVVPQLVKAFKQSSMQLPWVTRMLVAISNGIRYSIPLDILVAVGLIGIGWYLTRTPRGKDLLYRIVWSVPLARELMKKIALVRLTRTLGSLIGSGMPILEALQLSADSVGNQMYQRTLLHAVEEVRSGVPLSRAMENYGNLYPKFLTGLVVVGERTGTLEHIFKTFADFYDDDIDNTLKDLTNMIEPLLLLFMGLLIGTIALSILMPIYQFSTKLT